MNNEDETKELGLENGEKLDITVTLLEVED